MQEQLIINKVEIETVRQRIMKLRDDAVNIECKIPSIEGEGEMVTETYAMAESFETIRESMICLLDNTIKYIDYTVEKFEAVDQKYKELHE